MKDNAQSDEYQACMEHEVEVGQSGEIAYHQKDGTEQNQCHPPVTRSAFIHWPLTIDHWPLNIDHWTLNIEHWPLNIEHWTLNINS